MGLEFRLLGPLEVAVESEPVRLGGPKERALLALLVLEAGELVTGERLVEEVWQGARGGSIRSVQVYVSKLRRLLGDASRIRGERGGYRLLEEPYEIDARRFQLLLDEGRERLRGGEVEGAAATLAEALSLWRGPALADLVYEPFAQAEAARLEELRLVALEERIEAELTLGRHGELVAELEALVAAEPLRERVRRQLMLALYRCGRQADALAAYRDARRTLRDELGLEPSSGLRELEAAILRQDPALTIEPAELRERRRLPAPATSLIGRRSEVERVGALIRGDVRLVTLTGPGGTGKTRLAIQTAYELADRFPDGVDFVGLAALGDPELVLSEIATALEVSNGRDAHAVLARHLRTRSELLVIDNFEHVDAAAPGLASLLSEAPGLKLLVTSRRPLRVYGEHEFPVAPLALDEEAVPLFLERARGTGRPLEASEDVREICRRLDCLPLAIELAASRARELTPAEMRSLLAGRLELASAGPRDLPARQQTLRAAIEWSYELLEEDERLLFAALGVFSGGWTKEAAAAVCDGEPRTLAALVEASLVVRQEERFAMLETIREYALERLRADLDDAALRRRHAEYFVELGVRAEPELKGAATAAALDRLQAELDNLRAALDWSLEREPDAFVRLVDALYVFWYVRGHYREGLRRYERALRIEGGDPSARAAVVKRGAALAFACREFSLARSWINDALRLYRTLGDKPNTVRCLTLLGLIATNDGAHDEAVALLEESTTLAREAGDENVLSFALSNLGYAALTAGDLELAYAASLEALELHRACPPEEQSRQELGTVLGNLGNAAFLLGRLDEARAHLGESLSVRTELRDALGLASTFTGLAALAAEEEAFTRAARLLGAVDAARERTDAELEPLDVELYERTAAAARERLTPERFASERGEGRRLSLEEAAAFALDGVSASSETGGSVGTRSGAGPN